MKNVLLKFAGLFVEKVPVDEKGRPAQDAPHPTSGPPTGGTVGGAVAQPGQVPASPQPTAAPSGASHQGPAVAVALRAQVPESYAGHLAPFGVNVMAAGGTITGEQARGWGAEVLIVAAECLGQDVQIIQQPDMPTVFIAPQPVMIPDVPGLVQVQEPLRASEVADAARSALKAFSNATKPH